MRLNKTLCIVLTLILFMTISSLLMGDQESKEEKQKKSLEDRMITKIIKVKYADVKELEKMLWPFISREKGVEGYLTKNENYNTITVHDLAKKVSVIEEVINQFDVKPAGVEFTFHLLKASDMPKPPKPAKPVEKVPTTKPVKPVESEPPTPPLPPDIQPIVEKLKTNFTYKHYRLLDTASIRNTGSLFSEVSLGDFVIYVAWSPLAPNPSTIKVNNFILYSLSITRDQYGDKEFMRKERLSTALTLEDGIPVVVGSSRAPSDEEALITIVKARILKE
jgi:hypothetical protein